MNSISKSLSVRRSFQRSFTGLSLSVLLLSGSLGSAQRSAVPMPVPMPVPMQPNLSKLAESPALSDLPELGVSESSPAAMRQAAPNAAEAELQKCQNNLLQNGDIGQFSMGANTNFPPSVVPSWDQVVYSPQISPAAGFGGAKGWLLAWGYQDGGESFAQKVNLAPGKYKLTLAARPLNTATTTPYARYRIQFAANPTNNPWQTTAPVILDSGAITALPWQVFSHTFTLTAGTNVMQVNTFNNNPAAQVNGHPQLVSWMGYDSFCLQRVTEETGVKRGMTWSVRQVKPGLVNVGNHATTDPYKGDTPVTQALPMLCIRQSGLPVPAGITPDFYHGWSKGEVKLTPPLPGWALASSTVADAICGGVFGVGWRMGEFHDGQGGHSYWAQGNFTGTAPAEQKFWAAINDQPANPWNSVP